MLLPKVQKAIRTDGIIEAGDHILVGVSGGADSVALLTALHTLGPRFGFRVTAAHLNHGIRGRAARDDAEFVSNLAAGMGVPCIVGHSNVPRLAKRGGHSIEMAARAARYAFFARSVRKVKASAVATAHTADDQAETILLKLIRGAGSDGLSGIPRMNRVSGVSVIRPMLEVTRAEIVAFLDRRRLAWREDLSNRDVAFPRNRVRHELLPLLERRFNPSVRAALRRTAAILGDETRWMNSLAADLLVRHRLPDGALAAAGLRAEHTAARRRILRLWLAQAGIPIEHLTFETLRRAEGLAVGRRGAGRLALPSGATVRRQYDRLALDSAGASASPAPFRVRVRIPGETFIAAEHLRVGARIEPGLTRDRGGGPGRLPARASIRLSSIGRRALFVRAWKAGDRMRPLGMSGSKKLQDIFVDAKLPAGERGRVAVFECGGDIVWIPGYRVARGWEILDPSEPALQLVAEGIDEICRPIENE